MIRFILFCSVVLPLLCHASKSYPVQETFLETQVAKSDGDSSYILPNNLKPIWYNLNVLPFLENRTFKGKVDILFEVVLATDTIVLNLNNDSIDTSSLIVKVSLDGSVISVLNTPTISAPQQMISFKLNSTLEVGKLYNISISYKGILGEDMSGFYISSYNTTSTNSSGPTVTVHRMAVTQFESTSARKAFPCFDEPAYRARFNISILRPFNFTSVSNMPLISSSYHLETGRMLDIYESSPPMPTYLVAFAISDLANITDNNKVRVFARKEVLQEGNYTQIVAQRILDEIEGFLGIPYSLKKMDILAIPDFAAGAMENWGLTTYRGRINLLYWSETEITKTGYVQHELWDLKGGFIAWYREKYVLYNQYLNTHMDKYRVLSVVAHEFGHQWFGDLVTPLWWDYAWLNEAFATYCEYRVPILVEPQWLSGFGEESYVMFAVQGALASDTGAPRPMTSRVYSPDQIESLFDYVIYDKGGSILRMTENFLTTRVWQSGLKEYLSRNRYGTGDPKKLFGALQNAATSARISLNVSETLQHWTTQPGYPVIHIVRTPISSSSNTTTFNITQAPFDQTNSSQLVWNVPLTYRTANQTVPSSHWLLPSSPNTSVLTVNTTGWVLFNVNQTGFYRVNYEEDTWKELAKQLTRNHLIIESINRGQLIDDGFQLARTAHLSYATAFSLLPYITKETSVVAWNAFFKNMRYLISQFSNTDTGEGLKQYSRSIVADPFQALVTNFSQSFSTIGDSVKLQYLAQFSCEVELPKCELMGFEIFQMWGRNKTSYWILPEIKQTVFCIGLKKNSTLDSFMDVFTAYLNSNNAAEKLTILGALGCLTNEDVITVYLKLVCDEYSNYVRLQDRWISFLYLAKGQASVMPTLRYIVENYNKTTLVLGPRISAVYAAIGQTLSQTSHIEEVKRMVNDKQVDPRLRDTLNNTVLSAVSKRIAWTKTPQAESLKSWITSQTSSAPSTVFSPLLLIAIITLYMATNS